jgi:hypothetical protein
MKHASGGNERLYDADHLFQPSALKCGALIWRRSAWQQQRELFCPFQHRNQEMQEDHRSLKDEN